MTGLTGARHLLRLAWRRDRWMIGVTLTCLFLLAWYTVVATHQLYTQEAQLRAVAEQSNRSAAVVALYGRVHGAGTLGGVGTLKNIVIGAVATAFLAIAIVRRHTRADEETGRYELLGAGVVGRRAALAAAVGLAVLASLASGAVGTLAGAAAGLPLVGSVAQGLAFATGGLAWAGLTAVAVQLTESNRTAGAMALGSLAVAYVLRGVGDVCEGRPGEWVRWLSPLGWAQQLRAFGGERFWVVLLPLGLLAAGVALAAVLVGRRDPGRGVLAPRSGPARGRLRGASGLAGRLQRGALAGWAAVFVMTGALLGLLVDSVGGFLTGDAEAYLRRMGGAGGVADLYLTTTAGFCGLMAAASGIAVLMRLRAEEEAHRAEMLLVTPVTRWRLLASHGLPALLAAAGGPVIAGVVGATLRCARSGVWEAWGRTAGAVAVTVPAALVLLGAAMLALGALPRWSPAAAWGVLGVVAALLMFGEGMRLPGWVLAVSPFRHVPRYPVAAVDPAPLAVLAVVAAALGGAGAVAYRRRDLR